MKKKFIILIILITICECTIVLGLLAFIVNSGDNNSVKTFTSNKLKSATTSFNIKAEVEICDSIVNVKEELIFKSAASKLLVYVPSGNLTETKILSVYSDSGKLDTIKNNTTLEIECPNPQSDIHIEYQINLNKSAETLSYTDSNYYLTNFLITPAVYKENTPVLTYGASFGDPYIYDMNNYYVIFKTKKGVKIFAPGITEETEFGAVKISIFEAQNIRDFPAVLSNAADVFQEKHGNVNVVYVDSKEAKDYVNASLDFAEKNIGPYPYGNLFVVKKPLNQKGMEFSNMIFIGEDCFKNRDDLKRVTYHEVFHQWFYGIIGSNQLDEPFFDEGMVNFLSLLLCNENIKTDYNKRLFNLHLNEYSSRDEYYDLAYNNASYYFNYIYKKLGNNFYMLLQKLYAEKRYTIVYFSDFLKYVQQFSRG